LAGVYQSVNSIEGNRFESGMLYIAIGILGATVMPHNLYLHSSIAEQALQTHTGREERGYPDGQHRSGAGADGGTVCECCDSHCGGGGLSCSGHLEVAAIEDAHKPLSPLVGAAGEHAVCDCFAGFRTTS
jgi:manganese transport protein